MKLAVISDIHGNLEALEAVLDDMTPRAVDHIICLGDMIGYGPNPEETIELIRRLEIAAITGNHEQAVLHPHLLKWFNPMARASLEMTAELLSPSSREWLADLPVFKLFYDAYCVHGFPPQSYTTYLFQVPAGRLVKTLMNLPVPHCFIGHTHDLEIVTSAAFDKLMRTTVLQDITMLDAGRRYIINVGSVGQPRDGRTGAKYVIWDRENRTLEVRRVPYDVERVVVKIRRAGLPEVHAARLRVG